MENRTSFMKYLLGLSIIFCQGLALAQEVNAEEVIPRESLRRNTSVVKNVYKILNRMKNNEEFSLDDSFFKVVHPFVYLDPQTKKVIAPGELDPGSEVLSRAKPYFMTNFNFVPLTEDDLQFLHDFNKLAFETEQKSDDLIVNVENYFKVAKIQRAVALEGMKAKLETIFKKLEIDSLFSARSYHRRMIEVRLVNPGINFIDLEYLEANEIQLEKSSEYLSAIQSCTGEGINIPELAQVVFSGKISAFIVQLETDFFEIQKSSGNTAPIRQSNMSEAKVGIEDFEDNIKRIEQLCSVEQSVN
ncbi:MAG: hypothetical protein VX642_00850 [Bdellovibrionota bacterium]|nr:hypothetical protein [Bdellovibrionota bacterium]